LAVAALMPGDAKNLEKNSCILFPTWLVGYISHSRIV
jgi:hypothetical protein